MARRVALVKSAGRADEFARAVQDAGCVPVLVSPYREEAVSGSEEELEHALDAGPDWVAVTSPNAVNALSRHAVLLAGLRVAAVGPGTATALQSAGIVPTCVGPSGGAALAADLVARGLSAGDVVLHVAGEDARPDLRDALLQAGADVRSVTVYRMVHDPVGERAATGEFAVVVAGSPRLAARAAELFPTRPPVVAIGRTTAAALRDLGWPPVAVAATPTPADVAAALVEALRGRP